jgi:hypothetical protein
MYIGFFVAKWYVSIHLNFTVIRWMIKVISLKKLFHKILNFSVHRSVQLLLNFLGFVEVHTYKATELSSHNCKFYQFQIQSLLIPKL